MKILHITSWYPNPTHPKEALWIKRHIEALDSHLDYQEVLHLQVQRGGFKVNTEKFKNGQHRQIYIPTKHWFIYELISSLLLLYFLIKKKVNKKFDIINFHIAYPNLTYWHFLKKLVRLPIVITEHWSAYHFNFNVNKPLPRIQRIFRQGIPVITVSRALGMDIKQFSNAEFPNFIVPNIVDKAIFYPEKSGRREKYFFMVSQWSWPKNPFLVMEAFVKFTEIFSEYHLIIGGYGKQWDEISQWVKKRNVNSKIELVGALSSFEVAQYMRNATLFLHPSNYETFSVVCAEAVSCGVSVIASNVGGISEVVKNQGILINEENIANWKAAMIEVVTNNKKKHNKNDEFNIDSVGIAYYKVLKKILNGTSK